MPADENVLLVQRQFEAFGRGDVEVALAAVNDDVDWQAPVSAHAGALPWAGPRRGRQQVANYFRQLARAVRPGPFEDQSPGRTSTAPPQRATCLDPQQAARPARHKQAHRGTAATAQPCASPSSRTPPGPRRSPGAPPARPAPPVAR